jgi:capsid protein
MGWLSRLFGQPKPLQAKFDIAQTTRENRKHWAAADSLNAIASMSPAVRRVVRIRSRYEAENNSWYAGILRTAVNHIVGVGPRLQVLTANPEANARLERAFRQWMRISDFIDTLRTATEAYWRDGEVFMMKSERPRQWPYTLDVRLFECDQIATPYGGQILRDDFVDDGVRFDAAANELEIYVLDRHPGSVSVHGSSVGNWYPASQVAHLFRAERPGQVRGMPRATPSLQTLPIMRRQELATLYTAETAANFGVYLKSTSPAIDPTESPADFAEIEIARNMLTTLPAGWEAQQFEPKQPGPQYEMFQRQALVSFCRCTNMPYGLAAGTSKDSNFSSFKGDIRNVWKPEVLVEQSRIETTILESVFRWFLESVLWVPGVLDGMPAIDQIDHKWHWPPLPDIDPIDTANTASIRIATGQASMTQIHAEGGNDWDDEAKRAADDFGVTVEVYKAAVFSKTFGIDPIAMQQAVQPAQAATGEYTQLGQRAFTNNLKRIKQTLDQLVAGEISQVFAEQTLSSIGLDPTRIQALIADALDGRVDDPELQEVPQ